MQHLDADRLDVLATTSVKRSALMHHVPALAEVGARNAEINARPDR